jgi:hypothetical protein
MKQGEGGVSTGSPDTQLKASQVLPKAGDGELATGN